MTRQISVIPIFAFATFLVASSESLTAQDTTPRPVDASTLKGKILCGYQGWFRSPGDASGMEWVHWSRDSRRITPASLTFEMWPDMTGFTPSERFAVPGFSFADGRPAELFSSDHPATVLRHFEWMRDYGIDGAWLQHFVVDLPGGPSRDRFASRNRVLDHVRKAAQQTGRAWAITFDVSGTPRDRIFDVLTHEWKRLVDSGVTGDPRYIHQGGKPVVQVWGYYHDQGNGRISAELANRLTDFFHEPGIYGAYLVGGGDWNWRKHPDPAFKEAIGRLDGFAPWNVGNYGKDAQGKHHASMGYWRADKEECDRNGKLWLPVVYPGFSWTNLKGPAASNATIPRDKGRFLWEQFHELAKLGADSVFVAMFDEVDEGTAIFKVTSEPPTQAHFEGYEGLPSDWYLRLVGEGGRMLRKERAISVEIPIGP
jgi:hypothetical protein